MKADALLLLHESSFHNPVLYLQLDGRSWTTYGRYNRIPEWPLEKTFVPQSTTHTMDSHIVQLWASWISMHHNGRKQVLVAFFVQRTQYVKACPVYTQLLWDIYPEACWNSCPVHISHGHTSPLITSQMFPPIFVITDHYSKSCHITPLPKLPTAMETAKMIFSEVFRHYRLPQDIVSGRGVQFTSRVWKAFWQQLNINSQCNGQGECLNKRFEDS